MDAPGSGSSLIAGSGSQLRKVVGADGVDVAIQFSFEADGSATSELRVSGASLQPLITASTDLACASLACSLLKAAPGQDSVVMTGQNGVSLLTVSEGATTLHLGGFSAPIFGWAGLVVTSGELANCL